MRRTDRRWQVVHVTLVGAAVICASFRLDPLYAGRQPEPTHPTAQAPRFETDVLPLLQAKCLRCHGEKAKKAELDLRTRAGVLLPRSLTVAALIRPPHANERMDERMGTAWIRDQEYGH